MRWLGRQRPIEVGAVVIAATIADSVLAQAVQELRLRGIARGSVVVLVGLPDGQHDAYAARFEGSCLSVIGLIEQGREVVRGSIRTSWR